MMGRLDLSRRLAIGIGLGAAPCVFAGRPNRPGRHLRGPWIPVTETRRSGQKDDPEGGATYTMALPRRGAPPGILARSIRYVLKTAGSWISTTESGSYSTPA